MDVIIKKVSVRNKDEFEVLCSSKYGDFLALWKGTKPEEENSYNIEIEILDELTSEDEIIEQNDQLYQISQDENFVYFYGLLESVDEDGYCILRMDEYIVSLETKGNPLPIGSFIMAKCKNVELFDTGL